VVGSSGAAANHYHAQCPRRRTRSAPDGLWARWCPPRARPGCAPGICVLQPLGDVEQFARLAGQPVEAGNRDHVLFMHIGEQPVQFRPVATRTGHLFRKGSPAACVAQRLALEGEILVIGGHVGLAKQHEVGTIRQRGAKPYRNSRLLQRISATRKVPVPLGCARVVQKLDFRISAYFAWPLLLFCSTQPHRPVLAHRRRRRRRRRRGRAGGGRVLRTGAHDGGDLEPVPAAPVSSPAPRARRCAPAPLAAAQPAAAATRSARPSLRGSVF